MTLRILLSTVVAVATVGCTDRTIQDGGYSSSSGDDDFDGTAQPTGEGASSGDTEPECSVCHANASPPAACHSAYNPDTGTCICDPGYVYETADLDDFTCVPGDLCGDDPNASPTSDGRCICNDGYEWCSDDPSDLSCCPSG